MRLRLTAPILSTLVLACASGAAPVTNAPPALDFRSSEWLSDRTVINNNGAEIARVSDLILDRGTGRIEYMVIKSGTTLGMGGRALAIPFGSFSWDANDKDCFVLAATAEQLKHYPEYTEEGWKAMKNAAGSDQSALRNKLTADAETPSDPYAGSLDSTKKVRLEGVIRKVERTKTAASGEQVVVTVEETSGPSRRVALGPSWFVNSTTAAPMRGDKAVIEALALPRDPDQLLVATDIKVDGRELKLRDGSGHPKWALKTIQSGDTSYSTPYSRYLLMSHVPGMKITCRGEECGKVDAILVDRASGEIGFLSVDPNQNFLGIGDKKRLVPWSVATVTLDGTVRIDASKEMVLATPLTPADLALLNSGDQSGRVYKAFNVDAPSFDAPKSVSANSAVSKNAWAAKGPILSSIEAGTSQVLVGTVLSMTTVNFDGSTKPALAVKIRCDGAGGAEETILTGPTWYMDNQKPLCIVGDTVKIDAVRTTVEAKRYWLAKSIECKSTRTVMIAADNAPAWSN
jgi:sporulation protein YlmC with PRC-barrel domain